MKQHSTPLAIRFEPDLRADLEALAKEEMRPLSNLIKKLLREAVEAKRKAKKTEDREACYVD